MAISNLESVQSLFVGQGDLILFKAVENYATANLASLTEPKSLGQIKEDSSSWTGDDVTINEIKDEQGDLITATVSAGTLSFEAEIASTSIEVIKTFMAGVGLESVTISSVFGSAVNAVGFGVDLPVITRPIAWLNDEKKRMLLFPKAKIAANFTNSDKLMTVKISVLAEFIDRPQLKTGMVFDSTAAASYSS